MWQKSEIVEYTLKDIKFVKSTANIKRSFIQGDKSYRYDWQTLKDKLIEDNYDPEKYGYIWISKDGYIFDGHHRTSVLQNIFIDDVDKKILVKKSTLNYNLEIFLIILTLLILSPILIGRFLFKKLKSIFK